MLKFKRYKVISKQSKLFISYIVIFNIFLRIRVIKSFKNISKKLVIIIVISTLNYILLRTFPNTSGKFLRWLFLIKFLIILKQKISLILFNLVLDNPDPPFNP